jgi:hypothetical protein
LEANLVQKHGFLAGSIAAARQSATERETSGRKSRSLHPITNTVMMTKVSSNAEA